MNPFALHGPAFLAFYAAVGIAGLILQYVWSRARETRGAAAQPKMTDPYKIAFLRSGGSEALRVAALSLMERKLLTASGRMLVAEPGAEEKIDNPVEMAVLHLYRVPQTAEALDSSPRDAEAVFEGYRAELVRDGLLAGPTTFGLRLIPFGASALMVVGVGLLKLGIALSEGRHNVGYLMLMMVGFFLLSVLLYRSRNTRSGAAMLGDLEGMFRQLRAQADALPKGTAANEVALLGAVFGIAALPEARFPGVYALQPPPDTSNSNNSTWNNRSWSSGSSSSGRSSGSGRGCGG